MTVKSVRAHLQDSRALRQRLAGSIRMQLRELEMAGPNGCGEALNLERRLLEGALKELLVPGIVPPAPDDLRVHVMTAQRELQEEPLPEPRQRNRSILPKVKPVVDPEPEPEPEPDPGSTAEPAPEPPPTSELSGWRLSLARRRGLVTA